MTDFWAWMDPRCINGKGRANGDEACILLPEKRSLGGLVDSDGGGGNGVAAGQEDIRY